MYETDWEKAINQAGSNDAKAVIKALQLATMTLTEQLQKLNATTDKQANATMSVAQASQR